MTEQRNGDPLDELRRTNPVPPDQLPSASLARVRARVQEVTMTDPQGGTTPRRWLLPQRVLALASAGTLVAAIAAVVVATAPRGPGFTPEPSTPPGIGMCVEAYDLETLRNRAFAFDGTVKRIEGDQVTFYVNGAFRGVPHGEVTLTVWGLNEVPITPVGGPNVVVDGRYLVAGDGRVAWACGFTQPYDPVVAEAWATALRD